ncbi:hypothetical protein BC628DRAFT_1336106 [Trametes gibbosa]|nr:hypothetical protein BC628DRAFT_1336106 [Trametes gibbosa]
MRTRAELKSCLKITPPITPDLSVASSPCGSGRTSPSYASDGGSSVGSCGRKTVSFCAAEDLEEIFYVDEWDRSPAAVTPKLSYQDILELKQLRISLPYTPPPPTSRQPFTTSSPSSSIAGSSHKPAFPVSRFAASPSYTPSKWKNRSQAQADLDPEILPYLEAVPIRLLPLLPQSVEPAPSVPPEPHPQTPTPTASPERRAAPPPPSEPPEIRIESPMSPAPASPPSPVQRRPNFAFLPLLPIQDPLPVPPPPPTNPTGPVRPKRTFNMTFLPVNAVPENDPIVPSHAAEGLESDNETDTTDTCVSDTDAESDAPSTSTYGSSLPSPPLDDDDGVTAQARLEELKLRTSDFEYDEHAPYVTCIHTQEPGSYFPPVPLSDASPLPIAIPAHAQIVELPVSLSRGPGQTPPLSVLYPSPTYQQRPLPPLDTIPTTAPVLGIPDPEYPTAENLDAQPNVASIPAALTALATREEQDSLPSTPLAVSRALKKKIMLEALPSPALIPPSPFELDPFSLANALPSITHSNTMPNSQTQYGFALGGVGKGPLSSKDATTPSDSPLLTLETIRAAWDAKARAGLGLGVEVPATGMRSALGPSLSRRRSS